MERNALKNTLAAMVGKTFQYASQIHYIQTAVLDETKDKCLIKTNISTYERPIENMPAFLQYWQFLENIHLPVKPGNDQELTPVYLEQGAHQCNIINSSLADAIEKVKVDKGYTQQAHAINDLAKTMIAIEKTKLEIFKTFFLQPKKRTDCGSTRNSATLQKPRAICRGSRKG